MKSIFINFFITVMLIFSIFSSDFNVNANTDVEDKKVLVLFAYDYGLPTVDLFIRPMHEQLLENGIKPDNIYIEFLNLDRYDTHDDKQSIMSNLESKYQNVEFDIIVASTLDDANFMAAYGENLSPSSPLIIAGFEFEPSWEGSPRKLIKMTTELLTYENVTFAFSLFPNTKKIFIVSGSGLFSNTIVNQLKIDIQAYNQNITITDSTDMAYEDMLAHIQTLNSDTIVFFTSYFQDKDGQNYVPAAVASNVSMNSNVAIFGLRDVHVYKGNLSAGIVYDTTAQGVQIADIISDYFQGNIVLNSEDIEIAVAPVTIINWERLTFYGANLKDIPEDAIILNYVPTIWEEHRQSLLQLFAVIGILIVFGAVTNFVLFKSSRINKRFNTIGTNTETFIWEINLRGKFRYLSKQVNIILGEDKKSVKKYSSIFTLIDPYDENNLKEKVTKEYLNELVDTTITTQCLDLNNHTMVLASIFEPIYSSRGTLRGYLGSTQNITEKIEKEKQITKANEKILQSEKEYRLVSQVSNTGVWEFDAKTNYFWCSPEYFTMLGLNPKDFTMGPDNINEVWVELIHPDCRERSQVTFTNYLKEKPNSMYEAYFRLKTNSGDYRWIWSRGNFIRDDKGNPSDKVIGTHIDVTEQRQKEEEIRFIGNHDALTSLPNRIYYLTMLNHLDNIKHYPLSVMLMDINGLKIINDSLGYETGNTVIKQFANILISQKREQDFVARISGDEFIILCPNTTLNETEKLKQSIIDSVAYKRIKNIGYSIAFGLSVKDTKEIDVFKTVTEAENNMYKHKVVYGQGTRSAAIESVFSTLTNKYSYEKAHSKTVAMYCRRIGETMNLSIDEINELELAGRLHDIGKISIDDSIIMKSGKLNPEEWKKIKEHTVIGYRILRAADEYSSLAEYAMSHHERMDGKGYPNGLKGDQIPFFARIICVADAFEAMTSDRTYRKALDKETAIEELRKHSGTQFDPKIVDVFIDKVL